MFWSKKIQQPKNELLVELHLIYRFSQSFQGRETTAHCCGDCFTGVRYSVTELLKAVSDTINFNAIRQALERIGTASTLEDITLRNLEHDERV